MLFLYRIGVWLYGLIIWGVSPFHNKAEKFINGRKYLFADLAENLKGRRGKLVWVHAASLGEFEQAKPLIALIKDNEEKIEVLVTFFSPSGYESGADHSHVDYACYLPLDSPSNARKFVGLVRPDVAVFIKYEYWYYHLMTLHRANIPVIVASGIFRENQLYFHPAGRFFLRAFKGINTFFLQDNFSASLLRNVGLSNFEVVGDTRFDRVIEVANRGVDYPLIEAFKGREKLMVFGSVWPSDLDKLDRFILEQVQQMKMIIAPHNLEEGTLSRLDELPGSIRYSQGEAGVEEARILILDTIGMLAEVYRYGEFAYVGGGFRGGLHNVLEPAVYGIPVFFGEHTTNQKFIEARELIAISAGFSFYSYEPLQTIFDELWRNEDKYMEVSNAGKSYVNSRNGATEKVVRRIMELL